MVDTTPSQHSGLIGDQPIAAEALAKAKIYRREPGFPTGWLITPAALWLIHYCLTKLKPMKHRSPLIRA